MKDAPNCGRPRMTANSRGLLIVDICGGPLNHSTEIIKHCSYVEIAADRYIRVHGRCPQYSMNTGVISSLLMQVGCRVQHLVPAQDVVVHWAASALPYVELRAVRGRLLHVLHRVDVLQSTSPCSHRVVPTGMAPTSLM